MAEALAAQGVAVRIFSDEISLRYTTKLELALRVYPRLAWFAVRSAVSSLILARPPPDAVVVGTDVEALVAGLLRRIVRPRCRLVFETMIVTPRRSPRLDALYQRYYRLILSLTDLAICHAAAETERYRAAFAATGCRFTTVPFGTHLRERAALLAGAAPPGTGPIVTAGRSGRDYLTLVRAIEGLDCRLDIICDVAAPLAAVPPSPRLRVMRQCFDMDYLRALAGARFVVVPLAIDDISAGQMVMLQAAALARAIIMTRTSTSAAYAADGVDSLLVERGDVAGLRAAITRLLDDPQLCARLGQAAAARFDREHSTQAYARGLVQAIVSDCAVSAPPPAQNR